MKNLKNRVAVAAIRGVIMVHEIASKYEVYPAQVARWKKEVLASLPTGFSNGTGKRDKNEERLREQLHEYVVTLSNQREKASNSKCVSYCLQKVVVVGVAGFEPATSSSRTMSLRIAQKYTIA